MSHVVFNSGALDASMKVVAHFALVVSVEFSTKEDRNVIGFYGMDGRPNDVLVDGLKIGLAFEDDVGAILYLHEAPIVTSREMSNHRAEFLSKLVELLLKPFYVNVIGQLLCSGKVIDAKKGIVDLGVTNALLVHFCRQLVVPIEIELQTEGSPRRDSHIAQAQILDYEVEVVMETLCLGVLQESLARLLVVPGRERRASFHCREDMHHTRMITAACNYFLDAIFFAEILATNKLYLQTAVSCYFLCVFPNLLSQRLCESRVIKDADLLTPQVTAHSVSIANLNDGPGDHNTVKTRDNPENLVGISLDESFHRKPLRTHVALMPAS